MICTARFEERTLNHKPPYPQPNHSRGAAVRSRVRGAALVGRARVASTGAIERGEGERESGAVVRRRLNYGYLSGDCALGSALEVESPEEVVDQFFR